MCTWLFAASGVSFFFSFASPPLRSHCWHSLDITRTPPQSSKRSALILQNIPVSHIATHLEMGLESGVKKRHGLGSRMALSVVRVSVRRTSNEVQINPNSRPRPLIYIGFFENRSISKSKSVQPKLIQFNLLW